MNYSAKRANNGSLVCYNALLSCGDEERIASGVFSKPRRAVFCTSHP
jgi:hypothetical protein